MTRLDFNKLYRAHWPPTIQSIFDMPDESSRLNYAKSIAADKDGRNGYLIDVPIMVWDWDPYTVMMIRHNQGYTWTPSANQPPVPVVPGIHFPGLPDYDPSNPPLGSIKVINPDDDSVVQAAYPPFEPPTTSVPPQVGLVGLFAYQDTLGRKHYYPGPGVHVTQNRPDLPPSITENDVTYSVSIVRGLMGWSVEFISS